MEAFVLLLEGFEVVVGLGEVGDTNLEILAALVVEDGEFFVLHDESAVLALNNFQAGFAFAVVVVGLDDRNLNLLIYFNKSENGVIHLKYKFRRSNNYITFSRSRMSTSIS